MHVEIMHQHLGTKIRKCFRTDIGIGDLFLLHLPNTSMTIAAQELDMNTNPGVIHFLT